MLDGSPDWLRAFPNSLFARELASGSLRFSCSLEDAYLGAHLERVHRRAQVWSVLAILLALILGIEAGVRTRFASGPLFALGGIHLLVAGAMAYLTFSDKYWKDFLRVMPTLSCIFGALVSISVALALTAGRTEAVAELTLVLFGLFFFSGILFLHAVTACAVTLAAFVVGALLLAIPGPLILNCLAGLLLTAFATAIVKRDVEKAYRRNYLESALLTELVSRDGLTGLMNRRAFDEHLRRVWQQALRDKRPVAVLMIDIDHFKAFNDQHGHLAGDVALQTVAGAVQEHARRPLDIAARYGGEEFVMVLYDLPLPQVRELAERMRRVVCDLDVGNFETARSVTLSIGVGYAVPMLGRSLAGIVQLADEALYKAKKSGRNRVEVHGVDAYAVLNTGVHPQLSRR